MHKPYQYSAIHKTTKEIREFSDIFMRPYQPSGVTDENYEWVVYIDTRYAAKLRLYNYIHKIPPYRPYAGTEIGKSIPILNF